MSTSGKARNHEVIAWLKAIENKPNQTFLSFDIVDFYPLISEELLDRITLWAKSLITIPDEHIEITKHARKSLLFNDGNTWLKGENESLFDVTMVSHDDAKICELVGLYILCQLSLTVKTLDSIGMTV